MEKMKSIQDYYDRKENLLMILHSVENPSWRVWKVEDKDGRVRQNRKKINTVKKLREFLGPFPNKLYVSVAQFLQPQRCFGRKLKKSQYIIDDSLFVKSSLLFDIDHDDLEVARSDTIAILDFMKTQKSYELLDIRFSGNRGFHLLYKDIQPLFEPDPLKRLAKTESKRKRLVRLLPELQTIDKYHKSLISDQFRVHAAMWSVKGETGQLVFPIPESTFRRYNVREITYGKKVVRQTPMIKRPHQKPGKERSTLISYPLIYHFINNGVNGIRDHYITVLKYPQGKKVTGIIKQLQKYYNLDTFYKMQYKDKDMYINLKIVHKRRLEKIMRYSGCSNLGPFLQFGNSWIPITEVIDNKGELVHPKPVMVEIIESKYGKNHTHSRPHCRLFSLKYPNMAGQKFNPVFKVGYR